MYIEQENNGNIIIKNRQGNITHILSSMSVQIHPRKENALLIESKELTNKIEFIANKQVYINKKEYNTNTSSLLEIISQKINLNGKKVLTESKPKTKEQDPLFVAYLQANTYEKLLDFVKKHYENTGGKTYEEDKLVRETFFCVLDTFNFKIALKYEYMSNKPNLIKHIEMIGDTQNVFKTKKVYLYDEKDNIKGYIYEEPKN